MSLNINNAVYHRYENSSPKSTRSKKNHHRTTLPSSESSQDTQKTRTHMPHEMTSSHSQSDILNAVETAMSAIPEGATSTVKFIALTSTRA